MRWMRRYAGLSVALGLLVIFGGCWTLSMNPLYTEKDLIVDPMLEGIWGDPENPQDETWEFRLQDDKSYRLVVREDEQHLLINPEKDGLFEVHLLKLGENKFLDLFPEEPEGVNGFYKAHVIPAHSFLRMKLEGHVLSVAELDVEWLQAEADSSRLDIPYQRREGTIVLTASTEELQKWVLAHLDEAFEDFEITKRLQ